MTQTTSATVAWRYGLLAIWILANSLYGIVHASHNTVFRCF
jgi:hypothetical protein